VAGLDGAAGTDLVGSAGLADSAGLGAGEDLAGSAGLAVSAGLGAGEDLAGAAGFLSSGFSSGLFWAQTAGTASSSAAVAAANDAASRHLRIFEVVITISLSILVL
jgi:hypothetical protein